LLVPPSAWLGLAMIPLGVKPTGTIGALACWAADSIKDLYLKRPGAMV